MLTHTRPLGAQRWLLFGIALAVAVTPAAAQRAGADSTKKTSLRSSGDTAWLSDGRTIVRYVARKDTVFVTLTENGVARPTEAWVVEGAKARRLSDGTVLPALIVTGYRQSLDSKQRVESLLKRIGAPP